MRGRISSAMSPLCAANITFVHVRFRRRTAYVRVSPAPHAPLPPPQLAIIRHRAVVLDHFGPKWPLRYCVCYPRGLGGILHGGVREKERHIVWYFTYFITGLLKRHFSLLRGYFTVFYVFYLCFKYFIYRAKTFKGDLFYVKLPPRSEALSAQAKSNQASNVLTYLITPLLSCFFVLI